MKIILTNDEAGNIRYVTGQCSGYPFGLLYEDTEAFENNTVNSDIENDDILIQSRKWDGKIDGQFQRSTMLLVINTDSLDALNILLDLAGLDNIGNGKFNNPSGLIVNIKKK